MKSVELLAELRRRGVELQPEGERLRYSAPRGALTPELREELAAQKSAIRKLLEDERGGTRRTASRIPPIPRDGALPLSASQERFWILDQLDPDSGVYQINVAFRLQGRLNVRCLEQSIAEIVRRHESLRFACPTVDGRPELCIADSGLIELAVYDLAAKQDSAREDAARRIVNDEAARLMSLSEGPLFRPVLIRLSSDDHILLLATHHFVSDGWSMRVLSRELSACYAASLNGTPSALPELDVQYVDVVQWQAEQFTGELLNEKLAVWKRRLKGLPAALELPTDRPRPAMQSFHGAWEPVSLPEELCRGLRELSNREGVTMFMTLLAALQTLLSRYTNQSDVVVGTAASHRSGIETEGLIGTFANNLPLRTDLSGDPTFCELLDRVRDAALEAFANQEVPFERLVDELSPRRDMSRSPLFQVTFILHQDRLDENLQLPGITACRYPIDHRRARFDWALDLVNGRHGLSGSLEYNTDLFDRSTIQRVLSHYRVLLEAVVANPDQRISELPLLDTPERTRLLNDWGRGEIEDFAGLPVHRMIEAQAEKTPNRVAISFEEERMTYRTLNERANRLAHFLHQRGVGPETRVALCLNRSPEMVVALLAVLKAGGAYVPLDPMYPEHRLSFMLEDSQSAVLVTEGGLAQGLTEHAAKVVRIDGDAAQIAAMPEHNLLSGVRPEHLAYVIYTSGSTGKPKGVQIEHRALTNFLLSMQQEPGMTDDDVVPAITTLSFDIATLEIFLPLVVGARIVLVDRETAADGFQLLERLRQHQVTLMQATPATWKLLLDAGPLPDGLVALCGGEALSAELAAKLMSQTTAIWNMYGPTETTVWSAVERIDSTQPILIGRPIANTDVYVLDERMQPVPIGVAGELFIGGAGLARGYLNRPELTAEKFVPHPFASDGDSRLYRTGDLARWHADGRLECLGRLDHQVKVRGFRIELGEIEASLRMHEQVRDCVVEARDDEHGQKRLVAYVVPQGETAADAAEYRRWLLRDLPDFMVPSVFVTLEALPLLPNGKIDRKALPAPDTARPDMDRPYTAPTSELEEVLADFFAEVLGIERVGIHDSFFELGGHSLLATRIVSRIRDQLQIHLPLRRIFEIPTVSELATDIVARLAAAEPWSEEPERDSTANGADQRPDSVPAGRI